MIKQEVGFVQSVQGRIAFVDGLPSVQVGELVVSDDGTKGYVGGLFPDRVEVYLLSDRVVVPGQKFSKSGEYLEVLVGDFLLGRVINALGEPIDDKPLDFARGKGSGFRVHPEGSPRGFTPMGPEEKRRIDQPAVGIAGRRFIEEQFDTGITVIDTLFPLGKGQRELLVGESRSGKSDFILDVVANQKERGVVCVYTLVGKPMVEVRDVWKRLEERGLLGYTVVVASTSTDPSPAIFLTPQTGLTIAQYFQSLGRDVLLILDDMGTHARNYREMSLLSGRPPGRESYPGDIFFQQARLLERAGCFTKEAGGGSITALPVIELALSEFAAFIPTNLMGMTDGHFLFRSGLAQQGRRPAIDLFLSVTRVGSQTQKRLQNLLAMKVKETLARGTQLEVVSRFGSELPLETQKILAQKDWILELLIQKPMSFVPKDAQTVMLAVPFTSILSGKDRAFVKANFDNLVSSLSSDPELAKLTKEVFTKKDLSELFAAVEGLKSTFLKYLIIVPDGGKPQEKVAEEEEEVPAQTGAELLGESQDKGGK